KLPNSFRSASSPPNWIAASSLFVPRGPRNATDITLSSQPIPTQGRMATFASFNAGSGSPLAPQVHIEKSQTIANIPNDTRGLAYTAAMSKDQGIAPKRDRKSTRLNSSHVENSYAVFCLKKKNGRKGFQKMILGSFAQDVLGATQVPVMVVKK